MIENSSVKIQLSNYLIGSQRNCRKSVSVPSQSHCRTIADAFSSDRDMIDLTLPRPYNATVRNALAASPEAVHLRNLGGGGGSFYAGGVRLLSL